MCPIEFDFAQNTKVADINKVPQDFRGLYKQDGEHHVLDTENVGVKSAISAITGLNTALKAARAEAKNRPGQIDLSLLKDFGATPEEIKAKFEEKVNGLTEQIKGVDVGKIKLDLSKEWTGKLEQETTKAKTLEGQLYSELVESRATSAIAGEKGDVELLMPFVKNQVRTVVADGKYQVRVVDAAGDVRYSGVTGGPMTVKELVSEMKSNERYGKLFASEAPRGGGGNPSAASRSQGTMNKENIKEMSPTDKISHALKQGLGKRK